MISLKWRQFNCHLLRISGVLEFIPVCPRLNSAEPGHPRLKDDCFENYFALAIFLPRTPLHFLPLLHVDSEATDLKVIPNYLEVAFW